MKIFRGCARGLSAPPEAQKAPTHVAKGAGAPGPFEALLGAPLGGRPWALLALFRALNPPGGQAHPTILFEGLHEKKGARPFFIKRRLNNIYRVAFFESIYYIFVGGDGPLQINK